jgi:hypothetical protein
MAQADDGLDIPTFEVRPGGRFKDHVLHMRMPSARFWIEQRRGDVTNVEMYEEILDAIISSDLGRDPGRLPPSMVVAIGTAWMEAVKAASLPPGDGTGSDEP